MSIRISLYLCVSYVYAVGKTAKKDEMRSSVYTRRSTFYSHCFLSCRHRGSLLAVERVPR